MPEEKKVPADTNAGETGKEQGDAHSQTFQVPERLKSKSSEELAKAYVELEKKIGEQSNEVAEARKKVDETLQLGKEWAKDRQTLQELTELIYADPERIKAVESWYATKIGQSHKATSNGESSKPDNSQPSSQSPQDSDTRRALQNQIFDEFYVKYGIDKLPTKEKKEALEKISLEFADLFDPTGKKSVTQIVNERPLSSLRRDLDKAYKLTSLSKGENLQGDLAQEQNNQAAIGGISGKTIREDQVKLSAAEEQMAKNLGISSEKYLERKKQILKERGSVS